MEYPFQQDIIEQGKSIAKLQEGERFRDAVLTEIKDDVKDIKKYLEQQKGATKVVAVVAGVIGSAATFVGQFLFQGFKPQ